MKGKQAKGKQAKGKQAKGKKTALNVKLYIPIGFKHMPIGRRCTCQPYIHALEEDTQTKTQTYSLAEGGHDRDFVLEEHVVNGRRMVFQHLDHHGHPAPFRLIHLTCTHNASAHEP
jgi:hypothetical protein